MSINKKAELRTKWRLRSKSTKLKNFKSLEDIWFCLFVFIVQIICIHRACSNLSKFNSQSWLPNSKPLVDIWAYGLMIVISILLLPIYVLTSLIKIGSYANDNFKIGYDLDIKLLLDKLSKKLANYHIVEQQSKNDKDRQTSFTFKYSNSTSTNQKTIPPLSTSSFISAFSEQEKLKKYFNFISFMNSVFSTKHFWKHFMPVSCLMHIIIAFCLLYPNLKFTSKEIEYGLRPRGYIHHSEMDFLLDRPLQRFSDSQSYFDSSLISSYILNIKLNKNLSKQEDDLEETSVYLNRNQIKLQLVSSSLNDLDQINYEPRLSLEFFNFIIALLSFSIRYAATLWYSNKFYSLIFSFHMIFFTCLSMISYSAFEVLYKFESCFINGIKIKVDLQNQSFSNSSTFQEVLFNLPFVTNPVGLEIIYLSSMFLLLLSSMPIYSYGLYQYKMKFKKLRNNFSRLIKTQHLLPSEIEMENIGKSTETSDQATSNESCSSSSNQTNNGTEYISLGKEPIDEDSNDSLLPNNNKNRFETNQSNNKLKKIQRISSNMISSPSNSSLSLAHSSLSLDMDTTNERQMKSVDLFDDESRLKRSFYSVYKPFKQHIFALVILLIICVYSALIIYDYICLYQLTSDTLLFWSALFHILFVLWYILLWLILTFKAKWSFEFTHSFKLNYWNFTTKIDQLNNISLSTSSTSSSDSSNYSANECVEIISANNKQNRSSYSAKKKAINPILSSSCTTTTNLADYNQLTLPINKAKRISSNNLCMSQSMINDHNSLVKTSNSNINNKVTSSSTSSLANLIHTNSLKKNNQSKMNARNSEVIMSNQYLSNETASPPNSGNISEYENFNHNLRCSNSFNNLAKKHPSLRRLNQLIMSESQRLAPVFENTTPSSKQDGLNNQLLFLRRNIANNSYEEAKSNDNSSSSIYQSSILAVVNSQLDFNSKNLNNKSLNESCNTNTNDETISLIKKEEDSNLEYDLVSTSITNRLTNQNNKQKACLLNYASINELEKRASAIITNSLTKKNNNIENVNRGSFKLKLNDIINTNEMQLNELSSNLKKLSRTINESDSSYLTDSSPRTKDSNKKQNNESPKSNTSIMSDLSTPASSNSSSSSIITKQLNLHETDSGRHSMSDSPCNGSTSNSSNNSKIYIAKNKSSAGTFTSKVTVSNTGVTLAQTMQSLEKHQQQQSINNELMDKKKHNTLINQQSRSRDSNLMTKSSSFCKAPIPSSTCSIVKGVRSHSSSSRTASNCNINNSKNNINSCINSNNNNKCSSLSVNRNCSEL